MVVENLQVCLARSTARHAFLNSAVLEHIFAGNAGVKVGVGEGGAAQHTMTGAAGVDDPQTPSTEQAIGTMFRLFH